MMRALNYLDLDLQIEPAGAGYRARVLNSPAGQASAEFSLPFSDLEIENLLLRMGRPRRGVRRLESSELEAAKAFGGKLFTAVFQDEIRSILRSSLDEAERQNLGLRVRLRLSGATELSNLPWEYLYHPSLNRFLALSNETPLVRYLDLPEIIRPLRISPPLRLLALIPTPQDYEALDVEGEWSKLADAVRDLEERGLIVIERLDNVTLPALQRKLRQGEYHILHFVGHGGFDERAQDGVLVFEDGAGKSQRVSAQNLGTVLHDHRSLRLVVLNACEGARTASADPFAGVAQSLVQQRIPAVIAMQFEITDSAAITFGHEFYAALADGYPVDAALAEARKSIFAQGNEIEWATPVLYMRAPNGIIFDIQETREWDKSREQIATLLTAAGAAVAAKDWAQAEEKARAILALEPKNAEALAILDQVQEHAAPERQSQVVPPPPTKPSAAPATMPEKVGTRGGGPPAAIAVEKPGQGAAMTQNPSPSTPNRPLLIGAGVIGVMVLLLLAGCGILNLLGFGGLFGLTTPTPQIAEITPFGAGALVAATASPTDGPPSSLAQGTATLARATPSNTRPPILPSPEPTDTRRPLPTDTRRPLPTDTPRPIPSNTPRPPPTDTPRPADSSLVVFGRVLDSDNVPVEGINIAIIQDDTRIDVYSAADGSFEQIVPQGGIWNVQSVGINCTSRIMDANCNLTGFYEFPDGNVNVNVPQSEPIIFRYQIATTVLRGVVRDSAGQLVKSQRINALRADGGFSWGYILEESGMFALPAGAGTWDVYAVNFNPYVEGRHVSIQVVDGQDPEPITLEVP